MLFRIPPLITRNSTSFVRTSSNIDARLSRFPFLRFQLCCSLYGFEKAKGTDLATERRPQVKEALMMKCVTLLVITRHTSRYTTMRWFYMANKSLCPFAVPVKSYHETCRKNSLFEQRRE